MPLSVKFEPETRIVESTFSGVVSPSDLIDETVQAVALGKKYDCARFLSDHSNSEFSFSLSDVLELPELQRALGLETKNTRIAVIPPTSGVGIDMALFFETACNYKNWQTRVFGLRREALAWLLEVQV